MPESTYMNRAYVLNHRIDRKLTQLEALKEMAARTTSAMQEDPVRHTKNVHAMEDVIVKAVDLEREIDSDIDRLAEMKTELMSVINQIDDPDLQSILEQRYIAFNDWTRITESLGFSRSYVFKLHRKAMDIVKLSK